MTLGGSRHRAQRPPGPLASSHPSGVTRRVRRYGLGSVLLRLGTAVPVRSTDRPRGCCMHSDQLKLPEDGSDWTSLPPADGPDVRDVT